jgi:hypothetical protein
MKVKMFIGLFAIGLLAFNFSFKNGKTHESRLTLRNSALMQANAVEVICEAQDSSPCTYTVGYICRVYHRSEYRPYEHVSLMLIRGK